MSEDEENIVQYRVREMAENGALPDFLLWLCGEYPKEVAYAIVAAVAKTEEKK